MAATNSERSFNEALGRVLWTKHPAWRERLTAEQHRTVKGGGQPDLIVRNPFGAPVVLETEYVPARTVEQDAIARLGRELADSGYAVEQYITLRAPNALQETPQPYLDTAAAEAKYEYCLFTGGSRFRFGLLATSRKGDRGRFPSCWVLDLDCRFWRNRLAPSLSVSSFWRTCFTASTVMQPSLESSLPNHDDRSCVTTHGPCWHYSTRPEGNRSWM